MIIRTPSLFRALPVALAIAAGAWSASASAQAMPPAPAPAPGQPTPAADAPPVADGTIRLSDEQKRSILDNNTPESAAATRGELPGAPTLGRGIHGEIGAMIGTNGTRGLYGTAAIPLGNNAGAVISFETSRFGYRR